MSYRFSFKLGNYYYYYYIDMAFIVNMNFLKIYQIYYFKNLSNF